MIFEKLPLGTDKLSIIFCHVLKKTQRQVFVWAREETLCQNKWSFIYRHISPVFLKGLIQAEIPSVPEVTKVQHPIYRMTQMSIKVIACISLDIIVNYNYNPLFSYLSKLPPAIIFSHIWHNFNHFRGADHL